MPVDVTTVLVIFWFERKALHRVLIKDIDEQKAKKQPSDNCSEDMAIAGSTMREESYEFTPSVGLLPSLTRLDVTRL